MKKSKKLFPTIRAFLDPVIKTELYRLDLAIEKLGLQIKKVETSNEPCISESEVPIYKIDGKYYVVTIKKVAILNEILNPETVGLSEKKQEQFKIEGMTNGIN